MAEYVRTREFAKRLGTSTVTVRKAMKAGYIQTAPGSSRSQKWYDWETEAIKFIQSSKTPQRYYEYLGWDPPKRKRVKHKMKNLRDPRSDGNVDVNGDYLGEQFGDEPDIADGMSLQQARAAKEVYLARQAKVKFEQLKGSLISSEELERDWEEIANNLQQSLMAIPDRIDALLAAEQEREKCNKIVRDELIHSLESISDVIEEKANKAQTDYSKVLEDADLG